VGLWVRTGTDNAHAHGLGRVAHHAQVARGFKGNALGVGSPVDFDQDALQIAVGGRVQQTVNGTLVAVAAAQHGFHNLDAVRAGNAVHFHGNLNVAVGTDKDHGRRVGVPVGVGRAAGVPKKGGRRRSHLRGRERVVAAAVRQLRGLATDLIDHTGQIEFSRDALVGHFDLRSAAHGQEGGGDATLRFQLPLLRNVQFFERRQVGIGQVRPNLRRERFLDCAFFLRGGALLFRLLAAHLFQFLHFLVQPAGRLNLVVDHDAVRQRKEMAGVTFHDALHLFRPEGGDRRTALALAAVLPPRAERGEAQLDGFIVRIGAQPGTENGLHVRVRQSGAGEGFVGILSTGRSVGVLGSGSLSTQANIVQNWIGEGIEFRGWLGFKIFGIQTSQMRPSPEGAFKDGSAVFKFTSTTGHGEESMEMLKKLGKLGLIVRYGSPVLKMQSILEIN